MQAKQYGSAPSGAHPREMSAIILGLSGTSVGSGVKIKSSQVNKDDRTILTFSPAPRFPMQIIRLSWRRAHEQQGPNRVGSP